MITWRVPNKITHPGIHRALVFLKMLLGGPRSKCLSSNFFFNKFIYLLIFGCVVSAEYRLQTCRLSSCGSRAQLLRGMWDPPRPGLEPVSPPLAGRFSTTVPPGKPCQIIFKTALYSILFWCFTMNISIRRALNSPAIKNPLIFFILLVPNFF